MSPDALAFAIVIPAWNEASRLGVPQLAEFLRQHPRVTIHFVDDGSTDATAQVLDGLQRELPLQVRVLRLDHNMGKGEAVRRGLLHAFDAGCEIAGYLDADLAAPPEAMVLLAETLATETALRCAIGSRVKLLGWQIHRSERRHYLGRVFATFASITLGLPVYDTQCGAKLLRRADGMLELLRVPFMSRWLFDVELIARIRDRFGAAAMREVPLPVWQDRGGSSLGWTDMLRAPWQLWAIARRYPVTRSTGRSVAPPID